MRKKRKQRRSFQNLWRAMAVLLVLLLVGLGVYFGLQQRRSHTAINEAGEAVTSNIGAEKGGAALDPARYACTNRGARR